MQQLKAQVGTARAQRASTCVLRPASLSVRPFQSASGSRSSRLHVARAAKVTVTGARKRLATPDCMRKPLDVPAFAQPSPIRRDHDPQHAARRSAAAT